VVAFASAQFSDPVSDPAERRFHASRIHLRPRVTRLAELPAKFR
jgi:hypothetical protein